MLPNKTPPTTGADVYCPCSLQSTHRNLLALKDKGYAQGYLSQAQANLYAELCTAWDYYRPSQPANYQAAIDSLIDAIGNYELGVEV